MLDPYPFPDYVSYLRAVVTQNENVRGIQSELARAAGCQKSYFSQVLSGKVQLTPEHAFGLSRFLGLAGDTESYFLNLVARDRAGSRELREHYEKKLKALTLKRSNLSVRFKAQEVENEEHQRSIYYSSPLYSLIHMALRIESMQSEAALLEKFKIRKPTLKKILRDLERLRLIQWNGPRITSIQNSVHLLATLPKRKRIMPSGDRARYGELEDPSEDSIHYSAVYTLSKADLKALQDHVLSFIEETRKSVVASPADEELVVFNCDLFRA